MFKHLNKKLSFVIVIVFLAVIVYVGFFLKPSVKKDDTIKPNVDSQFTDSFSKLLNNDYKNTVYNFEGEFVKLENGISEKEIVPGSATKIVTKYFGKDFTTDLNKDLLDDVVFFMTQQDGGSGTFYYVVASLNISSGFIGSNAFFIGDRITPLEIKLREDGAIMVSYLDRKANESFDKKPSVKKEIILYFDPDTISFIQMFE